MNGSFYLNHKRQSMTDEDIMKEVAPIAEERFMSDVEIEYPYLLLPDVSHTGDSAMFMKQLLPYCVTDPLMSGVNIKTRLYAEATKAVLDHLQRKGIRRRVGPRAPRAYRVLVNI